MLFRSKVVAGTTELIGYPPVLVASCKKTRVPQQLDSVVLKAIWDLLKVQAFKKVISSESADQQSAKNNN